MRFSRGHSTSRASADHANIQSGGEDSDGAVTELPDVCPTHHREHDPGSREPREEPISDSHDGSDRDNDRYEGQDRQLGSGSASTQTASDLRA